MTEGSRGRAKHNVQQTRPIRGLAVAGLQFVASGCMAQNISKHQVCGRVFLIGAISRRLQTETIVASRGKGKEVATR